MKAYRSPVRRGAGPGASPRGLKAWFREQHGRTSYITVSVAGLSLLATLGLGLWNISLQIGRPELEPLSDRVRHYTMAGEWHSDFIWRNAGRQSANSVFITVYAADKDGRREDKLWAAFCNQTSVIPNGEVYCDLPFDVVNPHDHLLICVAYRSESSKKYRQAFRYRVLPPVQQTPFSHRPRWTALSKEEFPRPSEKVCR
jgi:hypothetical protein